MKKNLIWLVPLLILNGISLLNMQNAKLISSLYNNALLKQILWFLIGYLIILICNKININKLFKYSIYFYLFSVFLLIMVLFFGKVTNGARCWFNIFGFGFQPSELMKLSLIFLGINIIKDKPKNIKEEFILLLKLFIITIIPSILVFLEPDTGAIINYLIIILIIFLMAKVNKWWYISIFSLTGIIIALFFIAFFFLQDKLISIMGTTLFYRMDRIINFTSGYSYQLENALINIGTAKFFMFNLNKITLYIPEAPTDFIFAFTIGNFGLFSGIIITISYLILCMYLFYQAYTSKSLETKVFIYAFLGLLLFHIIYNIFMNIGMIPIMGIPLPYLSYGGSSTIINFLFFGIALKLKK